MSAVTEWCEAGGGALLLHGRLSPCLFETASSACVLLLFALTAVIQAGRLKRPASRGSLTAPGLNGSEAGYSACCLFLILLHASHVVLGMWFTTRLAYHVFYHATLTGAWTIAWLLTWRGSYLGHVRLHFLVPVGVSVLVSAFTVYAAGESYASRALYGVQYLKFMLWCALLQTSVASVVLVLEVRKLRAARTPAGYQPLADEEQGGTAKVDRTWLSLFVEACITVWPTSFHLRLRVFLCAGLLVVMRVLNLLVPLLYKHLVDAMAEASAKPPGSRPSFKVLAVPWLVVYLAAVFFQGGAGGGIVGFINNARQYLWIPVSQDAYRRVALSVFEHTMDLDLTFHLTRKTGEVTKVVDRGTNAIQNVLSTVLFSIAPQLFDVLAASTYLSQALEPWIAVIVFFTIGSYIPLTIAVTEWRGGFRRAMNTAENAQSARVTDALLNYETVKYFCNEGAELAAYGGAIGNYQRAEYAFIGSLNLLNIVQSGVMFLGVSSGMVACVAGVAAGSLGVGDVVLYLTLMAQLYAPLNFFGSYYRIIQQYMIDMENLFALMERTAIVTDKLGAPALVLRAGKVEFRDVSFAYDASRPVLRNVNVLVPGGTTCALVGATGSGKSTLTRLLFRFYDVTSGCIYVDDQDVRGITQASLRKCIGMVPQDCVLFNDTVMYNIRYGRLDATDEEVFAVARAACIHDSIEKKFPKGYDTVVGERGLKLSGGEKQRVAFARAMLKNPSLLLLDEATSALDSITEKKIQAALLELRQQRTTLIVAHRLSTIADAHSIVVMQDGGVLETGTHHELLDRDGLYAEMWRKQQHSEETEEAATRRRLAASASQASLADSTTTV